MFGREKATRRREELYRGQLPSVRLEETVREGGGEEAGERELFVGGVLLILLLLLPVSASDQTTKILRLRIY